MSGVQELIDQKKSRGERFGNEYTVSQDEEKALRAERFASEDDKSANPKLDAALDDVIKEERKARKAAGAAKRNQQSATPQQRRHQSKENPQQRRQQQPQERGRRTFSNGPAKRTPSVRYGQGASRPREEVERPLRHQMRQEYQARRQQHQQPRGRISNDDSFARQRSAGRAPQQQRRPQQQQQQNKSHLDLIDPGEAARRSARADRFK